jgi:hypothetical protein
MAVQTQIQTRRGSAATWTSTNPTLAAGEIGFESDTNKFKIGTGSTAWVSLPYASNVSPLTTKGDLYTYSTDNDRLAVGTTEYRLVADSAETTGLKYVADTTNYAVGAKGDLLAGTAADTVAALAVGNDGETLVADSSTSTGLRYTAGTVQSNPILNSAMQVWQRGTSVAIPTSTVAYQADRWQGYSGSNNYTMSRQVTNDTTNLPFIQYCARVQRTASSSGTGTVGVYQGLESINSIPFAGKTVTFSFYARAGANYSATANALVVQLVTGTGTDQNVQGGFTGAANQINTNATLTTTWQRFTYSATLPTTATQIAVGFQSTPTGTAGANDWFEYTGVQIDVGNVALPFRTYAGTIQGELAACQRYYQVIASGSSKAICNAMAYGATSVYGIIHFNTQMRTTPTISQVTGTNFYSIEGNAVGDAFDSIAGLNYASEGRTGISVTSGIATTQGFSYWIFTNNASAFLALQAEL